MGNRKKIKDNRLRLKKTLGNLFAHVDREEAYTKHAGPDEMFAPLLPAEEAQKLSRLHTPASDEPVIKVVDARHKGERVGDAYVHSDGVVSIVFDEDAPQWALDEIKNAQAEYNRGELDGSA